MRGGGHPAARRSRGSWAVPLPQLPDWAPTGRPSRYCLTSRGSGHTPLGLQGRSTPAALPGTNSCHSFPTRPCSPGCSRSRQLSRVAGSAAWPRPRLPASSTAPTAGRQFPEPPAPRGPGMHLPEPRAWITSPAGRARTSPTPCCRPADPRAPEPSAPAAGGLGSAMPRAPGIAAPPPWHEGGDSPQRPRGKLFLSMLRRLEGGECHV